MDLITETRLINLPGYAVGGTLYLLLAAEALRKENGKLDFYPVANKTADFFRTQGLLIAFGLLGCLWNFGQFFPAFAADFSGSESFTGWTAITFAALAFLPALLVQIEAGIQTNKNQFIKIKYRIFGAYALNFVAASLQFAALRGDTSLSPFLAFQILAVGYSALALLIFFNSSRFFLIYLFRKKLLIRDSITYGNKTANLNSG